MATSTLGYALLGLLSRDDLTGYEISLLLREPISFFWRARHSQIYPELAKLETAGLLRHRRVAQTERPDKKIYRLTPRGKAALKGWLTAPLPEHQSRDELVLRTFSLWLADRAKARRLFASEIERHKRRLRQYQLTARAWEKKAPALLRRPTTTAFADYATLKRGIGYERELITWCRWVLERLGRGAR